MNKSTSIWNLTAPLIYLKNPLDALVYTPTFFYNNHLANLGDILGKLRKDERFIQFLDDIQRYQKDLRLARKIRNDVLAASDSAEELKRLDNPSLDPFLGGLVKIDLLYLFMYDQEGSKVFNSLFEKTQPILYQRMVQIIEKHSPDRFFEPVKGIVKGCIKNRTDFIEREKLPYNTLKRIVDIIIGSNSKFANTHLTAEGTSRLINFLVNNYSGPDFSPEDLVTVFGDRYAFTLIGSGSLETVEQDFIRNHHEIEISRPLKSKTNDRHHQRVHVQARPRMPEMIGLPLEILVKTEADFIEGKLFYGEYKKVGLSQREKDLRENLVKKLRKVSLEDAREILFDRTKKILF